jgi:hypothetical protein
MMQYALKVAITAALVVAISEVGKRSTIWGAILASLPLTSLLAFVWMRLDHAPAEQIAKLSTSIFWLVLPSLLLFLLLPLLLRSGAGFFVSLVASCAATAGAYWLMTLALAKFGAKLL